MSRAALEVRIPVAVSARHVHLCPESIERLFGAGHRLRVHAMLGQPGQYAAEETVTVVGPKGRLEHVRVVGPERKADQVELSRSDELAIGLDAPLRESGDLAGTPGVALEGPAGCVRLDRGVICSLRHLHTSQADAAALGLRDQQKVTISVRGAGRDIDFESVVVRVSPDYRLELHLDTDEGNAAGIGLAPVHGRLRLEAPAR
ncbi:MAG: phosphate propanoyltransferase [Gammaproteobacteria bacterium]|nr:phosphate propanoyltransferase [Gammaproteobacteria bacterium]